MSLLEGEIDSVQVKHGYSHRMRPCKDNFRTKLSLNGLLNDLTKMFIVSGNHKYKKTECKYSVQSSLTPLPLGKILYMQCYLRVYMNLPSMFKVMMKKVMYSV